jgi:hypothetical protein
MNRVNIHSGAAVAAKDCQPCHRTFFSIRRDTEPVGYAARAEAIAWCWQPQTTLHAGLCKAAIVGKAKRGAAPKKALVAAMRANLINRAE